MVVRGHLQYYGGPMNTPALFLFRSQVGWLWLAPHALRRSQKSHMDRMRRLIDRWLPPLRLYYHYFLHGFYGVIISGKSRIRPSRSPGPRRGHGDHDRYSNNTHPGFLLRNHSPLANGRVERSTHCAFERPLSDVIDLLLHGARERYSPSRRAYQVLLGRLPLRQTRPG